MAQQRYEARADQNYESYFVISTSPANQPLDGEYCQQIKDQFGLTMPVLIDPDGLLRSAMGHGGSVNDWTYVLGFGGELLLVDQYASQSLVDDLLDTALAQ